MTTANVAKLAKALIKNYNVMGKKTWKEFLGFNIPEVIDCKEIFDFRNKYKCSLSINIYGIMFVYTKENVYKVEIYKNKICISKNKI